LFGILKLPDFVLDRIKPGQRSLIKCCAGKKVEEDEVEALSFSDELRTLLIGHNEDKIFSLLSERFNYRGNLALAALSLGDDSGHLV